MLRDAEGKLHREVSVVREGQVQCPVGERREAAVLKPSGGLNNRGVVGDLCECGCCGAGLQKDRMQTRGNRSQ